MDDSQNYSQNNHGKNKAQKSSNKPKQNLSKFEPLKSILDTSESSDGELNNKSLNEVDIEDTGKKNKQESETQIN